MGKLIVGRNDLATSNPTLASQWDYSKNGYLTPDRIACGSHSKVWWKCPECMHSWLAQVNSRNNGAGCPRCSRKRAADKCHHTRLAEGKNTLKKVNPLFLEEWDYELNNEIRPEDVTPHSAKAVWWKCRTCNSTWKGRIAGRSNEGKGCPVCAGIEVRPGVNDLATINPKLAQEWDKENNKLSATQITANSTQKVSWICTYCGHVWTATVASRHRGNGCPKCAKSYRTSLAEQIVFYYVSKEFPDAINEYKDFWTKRKTIDIYIPSLDFAIEYDGPRHTDVEKDIEKNTLLSEHGVKLLRIREPGLPEILSDTIKIDIVDKNHFYLVSVIVQLADYMNNEFNINWAPEVDISNDWFVILAEYERHRASKSFAANNPDLVPEWDVEANHGLLPSQVTNNSDKKVWWTCVKCGYKWRTSVGSRASGHGCPFCAGVIVRAGYNDIKTMRPNLIMEWDYTKNHNLDPVDCSYRSDKKVWWICQSCGYSWRARIADRSAGVGCPSCAGKVVFCGKNDLETVNPRLSEEWDYERNNGMKPCDVLPNSNKRAWWICKNCGHSWDAVIYSRNNGRGCPVCGRKTKKD